MSKSNKIQWRVSDIKNVILVIMGAFLTSIGLNIFVASKGLLPSGFTGLATLFVRISDVFFNLDFSFSLVYLIMSLVPAAFVYRHIGRKFTILSLLHIVLVSVFTLIVPEMTITDDTLLVCLFGGIFQGTGTLLSLKAEASSGGTDFIAMYVSQRYNRPVWNYVLIFNIIMLIISGTLFGLEPALYSIIYQFVNTQIVNTFHDRYHLRQLTIITQHSNLVSETIFAMTRRGITELDGIGKYSSSNQKVLYLVVSATEANNITKCVKKVDPHAFIADVEVSRVVGNFYQKPFE